MRSVRRFTRRTLPRLLWTPTLMPAALARACNGRGGTCPNTTTNGRCADCSRVTEQRRGSAAARGYTRHWFAFKQWFIRALIAADVVPVCGARWPGLPATGDSSCLASGLQTVSSADGTALHLDHTPPLTDEERTHARLVCDKDRVQLLCESCHAAKTLSEQHAGTV
jgi:hypothetical protein